MSFRLAAIGMVHGQNLCLLWYVEGIWCLIQLPACDKHSCGIVWLFGNNAVSVCSLFMETNCLRPSSCWDLLFHAC